MSRVNRRIPLIGKIFLDSGPRSWQEFVFQEGKKKELYKTSGEINSFSNKRTNKIIKLNLEIDLFLPPSSIEVNLIVDEIGFNGKVLAIKESQYKALDNLFSYLISRQLEKSWLLSGHIISPSNKPPVPIVIIHREQKRYYRRPCSYYGQGEVSTKKLVKEFRKFELN
ncbi:MAG: hypothetical protein QY321_01110 [Patescibacteria group bacterium]|nr:MAG: hypothetical protein QY321_01110 [Patescibacteria group bacterium]